MIVLRVRGAFSVRSKPLRQSAVLLKHEEPPCQLDHAPTDPCIASFASPFSLCFRPLSSGEPVKPE